MTAKFIKKARTHNESAIFNLILKSFLSAGIMAAMSDMCPLYDWNARHRYGLIDSSVYCSAMARSKKQSFMNITQC